MAEPAPPDGEEPGGRVYEGFEAHTEVPSPVVTKEATGSVGCVGRAVAVASQLDAQILAQWAVLRTSETCVWKQSRECIGRMHRMGGVQSREVRQNTAAEEPHLSSHAAASLPNSALWLPGRITCSQQ